MSRLSVLVAGCGNMGTSHARAYHALASDCQLVGLVDRSEEARNRLAAELGNPATFGDFDEALAATRPDVVAICTYPDTHAELARKALDSGAHLFVEKPLATTVEEAQSLVDLARAKGRKVVVGYILRVHPAWQKFTEIARTLGKPLVMRMNLNQQSRGKDWNTHKSLMKGMDPIVDCGVHYVDVMCQMTRSKPVRVSAIRARLSDELEPERCNYGNLQVTFEDGSVGWYEAGWGPMMSEVAYFIKDVVGPKGCVSITERAGERTDASANVESHTATNSLRLHWQDRDAKDEFTKPDEWIDTTDEPDHDGLCLREQQLFAQAIAGTFDPSGHLEDALNATRIVLAADESFRSGRSVDL